MAFGEYPWFAVDLDGMPGRDVRSESEKSGNVLRGQLGRPCLLDSLRDGIKLTLSDGFSERVLGPHGVILEAVDDQVPVTESID